MEVFGRKQTYQAMLTDPKGLVIFPRCRPDGSFCVEVTLAATTKDESLAEKIQQWLTEVWAPSNTTWLRVWKTGPGLSVELPELLRYSDEFLSTPTVMSSTTTEVRLQLLGSEPQRTLWKDWLVFRILPDLKAHFPEVRDFVGITDCA
jgi:hypothetical protein